jgi:hypothetical protein
MRLLEPHPSAPAILVDEFDAGSFESLPNNGRSGAANLLFRLVKGIIDNCI